MATAKTKKVALTRERRQETWHNLTPEQQAVLKQHIRYQHTSLFVDQNLVGHGKNWEFVAYNYNDNYDSNSGPQLYCDCGRRLKHQYVLQNEDGKLIKLGITHFADHIGIPEAVMRQLQTQIHHLDFGLDELLHVFVVMLASIQRCAPGLLITTPHILISRLTQLILFPTNYPWKRMYRLRLSVSTKKQLTYQKNANHDARSRS